MTVRPDHIGLSVGDLQRTSAFYCQAFRLRTTGPRLLADGHTQVAMLTGTSGLALELTQTPGSQPREHGTVADAARAQSWFHWALRVEDLDQILSTIQTLGGRIVTTPAVAQTRPGVRFSYIQDPEGNLIELTEISATTEMPDGF
ncbi:VOC family protein [Streptomyces djakartensis]|uniref:VOC family protein n=1 Tax=Streptomyces djakartensis TaxID=68193 RepID=UPI0034E02DE4